MRLGVSSLAFIAILGCGHGGDVETDASTDSPSESTNNHFFTQKGQIVDSVTGAGVPSAYVALAGLGNPADSNGNYSQIVGGTMPYNMSAGAPDGGTSYVWLIEQQWQLLGNADRGKTAIVPTALEMQMRGMLSVPPGQSGAMLRVLVQGIGTCNDVTGATISGTDFVSPDAGPNSGKPVLVYFAGNPAVPTESATSVTAGVVPSAIVYDLLPTTDFNQITVQHPTCKQAPLPLTDPSEPNIQYNGNVFLEATAIPNQPLIVSTIRLFLE